MDSNGNVILKTFRYKTPEDEEEKPRVPMPAPIVHRTSIDVPATPNTITADAFKFGIEVIDLRHNYDREEQVLRGLTMKVEHGSIYGLLGASGCGKTTLLKCIIGMMVPDSGFMDVFGRQPRDPDSGIPGPVVGEFRSERLITLITTRSHKASIVLLSGDWPSLFLLHSWEIFSHISMSMTVLRYNLRRLWL